MMLRELKEGEMVWSAAVKRTQERDYWRNLEEAFVLFGTKRMIERVNK